MRTRRYTTFFDLTKPFNSVHRDELRKIMEKFNCPERITHAPRSLMFSAMLTDSYVDERSGIRMVYITDGRLLNCRRMHAPTRLSPTTTHDLLFVDDSKRSAPRRQRTCKGAWVSSSTLN
ncbi:unnamed protein product [Schistocephalus solidus]|uniref:Reverse transcriptase domain-containing protein n=1 Tax=Schistocephalus solidus TaxID=70667 RepID=A0A183S7P2_SCHSO|nr:unnamed protein product [Schistocephalus solidus]